MQIAFGWTGSHLHRFVVQGREYGIGYVGGVGFRDDPHRVRLADLGLRPTERFVYVYDFTDGCRLDLRLEQILVMDPGRSTRAAPVAVGPPRRRLQRQPGVWQAGQRDGDLEGSPTSAEIVHHLHPAVSLHLIRARLPR